MHTPFRCQGKREEIACEERRRGGLRAVTSWWHEDHARRGCKRHQEKNEKRLITRKMYQHHGAPKYEGQVTTKCHRWHRNRAIVCAADRPLARFPTWRIERTCSLRIKDGASSLLSSHSDVRTLHAGCLPTLCPIGIRCSWAILWPVA